MALAQANEFKARLAAARAIAPELLEIVPIKTSGDLVLDKPLRDAGGKGLFTKELDLALAAGRVGFAVHSAKDLPTAIPAEIAIAGYLPRADVRDAWICPSAPHPRNLAAGSIVGTASLRRGAMVKKIRPDVEVRLLRGNVETRLAKLAAGDVHATLLSLAGLSRLGLAGRATAILDVEEFVPAAGQGAIAVTIHAGDEAAEALVAPILDPVTSLALAAERAFLRVLDGSCKTPIGGHARVEVGQIVFHGIVLSPDGSQSFETLRTGSRGAPAALGEAAARDLLSRIPDDFLAG